jgi:hypothetical protein
LIEFMAEFLVVSLDSVDKRAIECC